jgi:hypothetical protein
LLQMLFINSPATIKGNLICICPFFSGQKSHTNDRKKWTYTYQVSFYSSW